VSTLKIYTAGATREGIGALAGVIKRDLGIGIETPTNHGHLITEHVKAGETDADIVMVTTDMLRELTEDGLIDLAVTAPLGAIRIGAAVRCGEPLPDISTMAAFEGALRDAKSIVITEAPSGVHLERVFADLGLTEEIESRLTRYDTGTMVNQHISAGTIEGEIAFGVATEILFFREKGGAWAGPLPEEIQMINHYVAAKLTRSGKTVEAKALMDYLTTDAARATFAATGVEI
jgi:molybdate transport system substrate-binding protein